MRGVCGAVEVSQQDYVLTEERIDDGLAGAFVPNFVWPKKRRDAYRGHEGVGVQVQLGGYEYDSNVPQLSTLSFRDDAFSITRFTQERKTLGSVTGGGFGMPEPRTGDQSGAR